MPLPRANRAGTLLCLAGLAACRTGVGTESPPALCPLVLSGVTISPANTTIVLTETVRFKATRWSRGSVCELIPLPGGSFDWSVSNTDVARVRDDSGLVQGIAAGAVMVSVRARTGEGAAGAGLTVQPPPGKGRAP